MADKTEVLMGLAAKDPDALSSEGWAHLKARGVDWGIKGVSYPPTMLDDLGWNRHPSGYLVTGMGAAEIIRSAKVPPSSSAVYACVNAYVRHYGEPPLRLFRGPIWDLDNSEIVPSNPLLDLLREPSPWWTLLELLRWVRGNLLTNGNAYLLKLREGGGSVLDNTTGRVVQLHPISPMMMRPEREKGDNALISYFSIDLDGDLEGKRAKVPIQNVIHFREGLDPSDPRLGFGPVRSLEREINTDREISVYENALLRNLGVPGLVFAPKVAEGGRFNVDVDSVKDYLITSTTGDRRGEPLVFKTPTDVTQMQVSTGGLDLSMVAEYVESRISGVLGVPAVLAGLGVGLANATYSNVDTLLEYFTKTVLMSAWRQDSERWTLGLRSDFGLKPNEWIGFDYSSNAALQEDEDNRWTRTLAAWNSNVLTLGEVATVLGLDDPPEEIGALRKVDIDGGADTSGGGGEQPPAPPSPPEQSTLPAPRQPDTLDGRKSGLPTKDDILEFDLTEDDIDAALRAWDDWAEEEGMPELVGMLQ